MPAEARPARAVTPRAPVPVPQEKPAPAARPAEPPRATRGTFGGIRFQGVAFDSRTHRLRVADQPGGPGSRWPDAAAAAKALGGIAAVNAGFFTPEGAPLGLAISAGNAAGHWNRASSLGSGVWHPGAIVRREALGPQGARRHSELLQAGPMLVENGRSVSGLESTKASARTVILWDGGTRWWIGVSSPASLAETARVLDSENPAGWRARHALNLDGGRSSDLWVSGVVSGGPLRHRPPWNRPVRNFLVLVRR